MPLEKLPSIIANNKFNEKGLVETKSGLLVPAYVASQLGFNVPGKFFLENIFYPKLRQELGVLPLCPFTACAEYLDFSKLSEDMTVREFRAFWEKFNRNIGPVNYQTLFPKSRFLIALFDGSHASDDGLCTEVGLYAATGRSIIGIRSDFRLSENIAAPINPAVRSVIDYAPYKGLFFEGPNAYPNAYKAIKELADQIKGQ